MFVAAVAGGVVTAVVVTAVVVTAVVVAAVVVVVTAVVAAVVVVTAVVVAAVVVVTAVAVQLLPLLLLIHSIYCTDLTGSFHFFCLVALQCRNPARKMGSRRDCHSRVSMTFQ